MSMVYKYSTKKGKALVASGSRYEGITLNQVYDRYSYEKERAYNYCYDKYLATEEHTGFSICSHNTFQFTVSWLGMFENENAMFIETAKNSYIVLLDR